MYTKCARRATLSAPAGLAYASARRACELPGRMRRTPTSPRL